nr:hypothetical protein [Tanacetum cinerariifolium]
LDSRVYLKLGIWVDIIREAEKIKVHKKHGNRVNTSFWEDKWREEIELKKLYPRLYLLETNKDVSVAAKLAHSWWVWSLNGSGDFSVASVRKLVDNNTLLEVSNKSRWVKAVPIKVNIHAWKVRLDCLPTRLNISRRGLKIDSILCPTCDIVVESTRHIFFTCHLAREIFRKITCWWDVSYSEVSSYEEWFHWISNTRLSYKHKNLFEGVYYISWWHIWTFRNKIIFSVKTPSKEAIFEDVVSCSFYLCRSRCKASFSWIDWCKNPYLVTL